MEKTSNSLLTKRTSSLACALQVRQMAAADHPHYLEALDPSRGGFHGLEASGWANDSLEGPMIGLMMLFRYLQVRCFTSTDSLPSRCN
jgi:hypothetical protein